MRKKKGLVEGVLVASGLPCVKCGGSDPLAIYEKEDEDGNKWQDGMCYSNCGYLTPEEISGIDYREVKYKSGGSRLSEEKLEEILSIPTSGWKDRRIKTPTSEFFGIRTKKNDNGEVTHRYYPVTENDEIVGFHVRDVEAKNARRNKDDDPDNPALERPGFFTIGKNRSKEVQMFGQSKFPAGGKYLTIVGGEEDVASFYQIMMDAKGYKNAVISPTNGEGNTASQVKANYDYVSSFEKVIIMLDDDETGRKASEEIAKLLKPGQAHIAKLNDEGCKDPNDYLVKGKHSQLIDAFWKAEPYSPVGIYKLSQMWDAFEDQTENEMIPFPPSFSGLNEMMNGGVERGEVTVIGALTSIGKSSLISTIVYHLLDQTPYKVGAMYLESTRREVVRDLLSLHTSTNLRKKKRGEVDMQYLKAKFFNELATDDNFVFVDHQGSLSNEDLFQKLRYLAKAENCDVIFFDPIQAGVNSSDNGAIIEFMDALLKLAKETNVAIIAVSHMRKPDSDDPHAVSEYSLLGSSAINQIAFNTILLSRDKMSDDPNIRNSTLVQLVKCRRTGLTGRAGWLRFDNDTTHFHASHDPYDPVNDLELFGDDGDEDYSESGSVNQEPVFNTPD